MPRKKINFSRDAQYVLVEGKRPRRGAPINIHSLRMLADTQRFPLSDPLTTDPARIRWWSERTGPYAFMLRHPELQERFYVLNLTRARRTGRKSAAA